MILEYVENGQVMYFDNRTAEFKSKLTSKLVLLQSFVDGVLPENIAKKYLYDILLGLKYCIFHEEMMIYST